MATLNPQVWAAPQVVIAMPPNATTQETNQYLQELENLHLGLANVAAFAGLQNNVNLPNLPVATLGPNTTQAAIDTQIATLDLYCTMLMNAQGVIVQLMSPTIQNPQTPRSTIKAPKPEFDGTPGEKARGFITACTTYRTLRPGDFQSDEVFIAWALACITDDSKAASWKAHWLTLRTENISLNRPQPVELSDWDVFAREFLGKFIDPSETQRMQRHLVEMRQKTSCQDHTQEFNRTTLLVGMNGNAALPWLYRQSLKNDIQRELLRETYTTLEELQNATISTDDLLFSFRKQNLGDRTTTRKPELRPRQGEYRQNTQAPQDTGNTGNDPNAMELDRLSTEEYRRRWAAGLCFKCGKKGLARDCPRHNEINRNDNNRSQQTQYQPRRPGRVAAIEAAPDNPENQGANLALMRTQESGSQEMKSPAMRSIDLTREVPDFLRS